MKILSQGNALLLVSAISAAGAVMCRKFSMSKFHPLQFEAITGVTHAVIGMACLIYAFRKNVLHEWSYSGFGMTIFQAALSCLSGITFMFMIRPGVNIGLMSVSTSACITIFTLLMSAYFFDENLSIRSIFGIAVMMIGLFIAVVR